jgi:hypothetical protein
MSKWLCRLSIAMSLSLCGAPAVAQPPVPALSTPASSPDFLTHYNFHLSADALSNDDSRFTWQTHFGGDVDLVDYVAGRINVLIDYEAVLGNGFRKFDPNQGNYTLEGSGSVRAGRTEIAVVFHHVSRHLGDRPKAFAIAWNVTGVRALRRFEMRGCTIDVQGILAGIVQRSFVDYRWTGNTDVVVRRTLNTRVGVFAHGLGELVGVDPAVAGRGTQQDGRLEGGVRITGGAGAVELFAGYERRIDAYPSDPQRLAQRWALVGFRIVNR